MSDTDFDQSVIFQMQKDCSLGLSVVEIIDNARNSLGPKGWYTLVILRYFMAAFGLSLKDARMLEGCPVLGGSAFSNEEVDLQLRQSMRRFVQSGENDEVD